MKSATLLYQQYVHRINMIFVSVVLFASVCAQPDTVLTKEFTDLSAKERNRIAEKEQSEAESDVAYQAVMTKAEALFRDKRFEESLDQYSIARNMRPYNVFPKVKIQDLNALIHLQVEQERGPSGSNDGITIERMERQVEPVIVKEAPSSEIDIPEEPLTKSVVNEEKPTPAVNVPTPVTDQKKRAKAPPEKKLTVPTNEKAKVLLPDGIVERYSKEGRALICEREVTKEGKTCVYRRVIHPWGEIMYFKDQVSVPERAWVEAFED